MDYGMRLLRHIWQQVFGNIGQAARITLLLMVLPTVFMAVTNPWVFSQQMDPSVDPTQALAQINWGMLLLAFLLSVVGYLWAAVAWHRFVLLEEYSGGVLPPFRSDRIWAYFTRVLIVVVIMFGVGLAVGFVIGFASAILRSAAITGLLGIGFVIGLSWVSVRIGLILPAAAVGEDLTVGESWAATKPVASQILLPMIVIAVLQGVLAQANVAIFGTALTGSIVAALVSWLMLLLNLALMTTLYGNLIEGRELN